MRTIKESLLSPSEATLKFANSEIWMNYPLAEMTTLRSNLDNVQKIKISYVLTYVHMYEG